MKVGILTFPHSPSLGAMLQMNALYHAIQELGHDVEIINYVSETVNHKQKSKVTAKSIVISILSALFLKNSKPSFQEFENSLRMFPDEASSDSEMLEAVAARYDRIIVGSDQVWNQIVTGNDLNFYLAFCPDRTKKASYAASFGNTEVEKDQETQIAELLNQFTYLSVREKQGQKIVKDLTGREASVVLDPTLLVSRDYLLSQMTPCRRKRKYVLFFCIKPSPTLKERAEAYAKEYGFELVTIGGRMKDRFNPFKHPQYGVGPREFLGLVREAQCVFTNSFHGLAVSIALQTNFYVEYSTDTNSRLINLVELLDLHDRVAGNQKLRSVDVDYRAVEQKLEVQRQYSLAFLKEILTQKQN